MYLVSDRMSLLLCRHIRDTSEHVTHEPQLLLPWRQFVRTNWFKLFPSLGGRQQLGELHHGSCSYVGLTLCVCVALWMGGTAV